MSDAQSAISALDKKQSAPPEPAWWEKTEWVDPAVIALRKERENRD